MIEASAGHDLLFSELRSQSAGIGVVLVRVGNADEADLMLVDRVARYGSARWFVNQFNCQLDRGCTQCRAGTREHRLSAKPALR